ncbi:hypothetical protein [Nitrosopumilus sp.]|uniref:hypothetical protein n=1 Tax=Nitrosopumilus sp. TaxID=2024843 RepID=UPI00349FED5B
MKHIIILIGFVVLIQFNPVFAHTVTEFYGVGGCPVNSCGVTDWDLSKIASDSMFYVSLIVYSMIIVLFFYFLYKRKCEIRHTM